jgi:uncharacterized protein YbcI
MSAPDDRPSGETAANHQLMRLSDGMVRIYKEQFGRGPTRVRSNFAGPDAVMVVLEDTFTPAERNLAAMGEHQRLRDARLFFQYASEDVLIGTVEEVLGRRVRAFISGLDAAKDVSAEVFILEPRA